MMKKGIPDEINMQQSPHVATRELSVLPALHAKPIKSSDFLSIRPLACDVLFKQVSEILYGLVAYLHSHTLFRHGTEQCLEHQLAAVSPFVARKIGGQPLQFVTRDKCAIGTNHNIVQVVADRKLLAQRRIVQLAFVLFQR
jgi:hypothetical protein